MTAPAQLAGYDADGLGHKRFPPDAVVLPADAQELVDLMQCARDLPWPICLRGAGTSLSGGPVAVEGGIVVHTSLLRSINHIDPMGGWCEVECGVTLKKLDDALRPHGLFYPPDPSSGSVCTIGGNVAMNAGGAHCFRYGVTGNYVLGVEAVLESGAVHRFGGPGGGRGPWQMDWKRLMVGSEGTLAGFTRFWLRVLPRPEKVWTFQATFSSLERAEEAIHRLVRHGSYPVAIELMDPRFVGLVENSPMACGLPSDCFLILTEIDGPQLLVDDRVHDVARLLRESGADHVDFSDDEQVRQRLWKARKVAGGLMGQQSADLMVQDAVIPKSSLADLLRLTYAEADSAGIPVVNVFHAGDGNLHPNFLFDSRNPGETEKVERISKNLMKRVVEVGGTLSGEHGIGNDKTAYMPLVFSPESVRLQIGVPNAFNPRHQLNPRKVFDQRSFQNQDCPAAANGSADEGSDPRLFGEFFDPVDGLISVPVNTDSDRLDQQLGSTGLRFPLLIDDRVSLLTMLQASPWAPGSARFGPVFDNITGMNWRFPDGRLIRVGERVVKTTTGYDLFRFLLLAGGNWGEPESMILRLRPDAGCSHLIHLDGPEDKLVDVATQLIHSDWAQWVDSVDLVLKSDGAISGRIAVNSAEREWLLIYGHIRSLAEQSGLNLNAGPVDRLPRDGCPDLVLKTTPDRILGIARELIDSCSCHGKVILTHGVFHASFGTDRSDESEAVAGRVQLAVEQVAERLEQVGGDWHSRFLPPRQASAAEQTWITQLREAWRLP